MEQVLADAGMTVGNLVLPAKYQDRKIDGATVTGCFNEVSSDFCSFLTFVGALDGGVTAGLAPGAFNPDLSCVTAWQNRERAGCGLGVELAMLLPGLWRMRRKKLGRA